MTRAQLKTWLRQQVRWLDSMSGPEPDDVVCRDAAELLKEAHRRAVGLGLDLPMLRCRAAAVSPLVARGALAAALAALSGEGESVLPSSLHPGPDEVVPLLRLARCLSARDGKTVNRTTVYRWATAGLKSRGGQRVRLACQFVGGTICSTLADVERFFAAKNDATYREVAAPMTARERAQWDKRGEVARDRLRKAGVIK